MLLIGNTIIEHEDLFFGGSIPKEEPDLKMFRYNEKDKNLLKKMQAPESVYVKFNLNDIFYYIYYFFV